MTLWCHPLKMYGRLNLERAISLKSTPHQSSRQISTEKKSIAAILKHKRAILRVKQDHSLGRNRV